MSVAIAAREVAWFRRQLKRLGPEQRRAGRHDAFPRAAQSGRSLFKRCLDLRKEALMAAYHVSMIIETSRWRRTKETEVEQAVRGPGCRTHLAGTEPNGLGMIATIYAEAEGA
jgi:hypothetical protein